MQHLRVNSDALSKSRKRAVKISAAKVSNTKNYGVGAAAGPRLGKGCPGDGVSKTQLTALVERLADAAQTLRNLPQDNRTGPAGVHSAWPEMMRSRRFAVSGPRGQSRPRPSPNAIDDLDNVAELLWEVTPRQRQMLWARACGVRWAELGQRYRRCRATLNRDYHLALTTLLLIDHNQTARNRSIKTIPSPLVE